MFITLKNLQPPACQSVTRVLNNSETQMAYTVPQHLSGQQPIKNPNPLPQIQTVVFSNNVFKILVLFAYLWANQPLVNRFNSDPKCSVRGWTCLYISCFHTRNLRFCFHCEPWALVCRWASVTRRISSHSAPVGSGRVWRVFTISSFFRFSLFSSIRRRFATRFESSRTTGERWRKAGVEEKDIRYKKRLQRESKAQMYN